MKTMNKEVQTSKRVKQAKHPRIVTFKHLIGEQVISALCSLSYSSGYVLPDTNAAKPDKSE